MGEFRISVQLATLIPSGSALSSATFPNLAAAVRMISEAAHQQWVAYASGAPLPNGRSVSSKTGTYARSIMLRQTGDFAAEVYTELPYARGIEDGTKARDLHDILGSSLKTRVTKDGRRYLIIPFRSYQPNSVIGTPMPQAIHDWWKGGEPKADSHITGTYRRVSGAAGVDGKGFLDIKTRAPLTVPAWKYRWGTKLTENDILGMGLGATHAKRFAGMYRFNKPANGSTPGGGHTQFLNFRVMMEGSSGWRVPARPGLHIAQTVAKQFQPIAEAAFPKAMEADVRILLRTK